MKSLGLLVFLVVCTFSGAEVVEFTVLHTNDVHAHLASFTEYGSMCDPYSPSENCVGGAARRMTAIKEARNASKHVLLVDAGDEFQGTLFFSYYKGRAIWRVMNALQYDVMCLGNHEFDEGIDLLAEFMSGVNCSVLCANLVGDTVTQKLPLLLPYKIIELEKNGTKVAFVGVITELLKEVASIPAGVGTSKITTVVENMVNYIHEHYGVYTIALLSHAGIESDRITASSVVGLSFIVGGHSHTMMYEPVVVKNPNGENVYLVQVGEFGEYLGKIDVKVEDTTGKVMTFDYNPVHLDASVPEEESMKALIEELYDPIDEIAHTVVGWSEIDLLKTTCRSGECALGDLITDGVLEGMQKLFPTVSVTVENSGGIRASLSKGNITEGDIMTVLPFSSTMSSMFVNGTTLSRIFRKSIQALISDNNDVRKSLLQESGVRIVYSINDAKDEVLLVSLKICQRYCDGGQCTCKWEFVQDSGEYNIAVSSFLLGGGDGYSFLQTDGWNYQETGRLPSDFLIDYIKEHSPIHPVVNGRMVHVDGDEEAQDSESIPAWGWALIGLAFVSIVGFVSFIAVRRIRKSRRDHDEERYMLTAHQPEDDELHIEL